ncbi:MAG: hypothetical protein AB7T27_09575 [Kiritimatiellia bacterium]
MRRICAFVSLMSCMLLSGCLSRMPMRDISGQPEITPEQRAGMQSRIYRAAPDTVFAGTIAVLQDIGWKLDSVDRASGLIRATTEKRLEPLGPQEEKVTDFDFRREAISKRTTEKDQWTRWEEMVIHTEPWPGGMTQQRIVFSRRGSLPAMSYADRIHRREVMINAPAREESVELLLPEVYADVFTRINKAVTERISRQGDHP